MITTCLWCPRQPPALTIHQPPSPTHAAPDQNLSSLFSSLFLSLSRATTGFLISKLVSYYDDPAVFLPPGPQLQCDNDRTAWGATEYHHHHPHHHIWSTRVLHWIMSCLVFCLNASSPQCSSLSLYQVVTRKSGGEETDVKPRLPPIRHFKII